MLGFGPCSRGGRIWLNPGVLLMFRFSLRELFLTTTLAAACVAWWLDHERLTNAPEPPLMVRCGEDECMCVTDEEGKKL